MGILIDLKEVCLDYKPGVIGALKLRSHALRIYCHFEQIENSIVKTENVRYNGITKGDFALLKGNKND